MKNNYSILREQEYGELAKLKLNGKVLDLGGSKKSGYHELFKGDYEITTVNIDQSYGCDLVFNIEEKFPLNSEQYDWILCINVLEHIYNYQHVLQESSRVLKRKGKLILITPFIFQIHASPEDYFRYTKSALKRILEQDNFAITEIKGFGYGLFSLIFQIVGGSIPFRIIRDLIKQGCIYLDRFLAKISKRYTDLKHKIPLGYLVIAEKSSFNLSEEGKGLDT